MTVILLAHFRLVSTPIFLENILLLLPAALEVQIYEVNFFPVSMTPLQLHFASK